MRLAIFRSTRRSSCCGVLQERGFEPVGGSQTIQADVRVIAATHQDLEMLIAQGRFREDLYYRLNVIGIVMPPLRERREDILELALHFLMRSAQKCGKPITHIEPEALAALERHLWPGNVRELENVIERAVVMAEADHVTLLDLPVEVALPSRMASHIVETKPMARRHSSVAAGPASRGVPPNGFSDNSAADLYAQAVRHGNATSFWRPCGSAPATRPKRPACWGFRAAPTSAS